MTTKTLAIIILVIVAIVCGGVYFVLTPSHRRSPAAVLELADWKLQLPVEAGHTGQVDEVKWPSLRNYSSSFFQVNDAGDGIVFRTPVGGAKTPGADFARTELRQMTNDGTQQAAWSSANSSWSMTLREAIMQLPEKRPAIVAGQIHGTGSHYVALIRLDNQRLWVKTENGSAGTLEDNYRLGTVFTVTLTASGNMIKIYYNGDLKVEIYEECTGCYFKAGAYLQSNTKWDEPDAYGEVIVYQLAVRQDAL